MLQKKSGAKQVNHESTCSQNIKQQTSNADRDTPVENKSKTLPKTRKGAQILYIMPHLSFLQLVTPP
jgi:hypothetical protein